MCFSPEGMKLNFLALASVNVFLLCVIQSATFLMFTFLTSSPAWNSCCISIMEYCGGKV